MEDKHIETPSKNETPKAQISADANKESTPTRTLTVKPPPERVKNPLRVAQGKKLAEMSRNRKKSIMKNEVKHEVNHEVKQKEEYDSGYETESEAPEGTNFNTTAVVITTCATVLSAYIGYKQWKNSEAEPTKESTRKRRDVEEPRDNLNDLDKYAL